LKKINIFLLAECQTQVHTSVDTRKLKCVCSSEGYSMCILSKDNPIFTARDAVMTQYMKHDRTALLPAIMARQPLVGQGFLIAEVPRSHSDSPHSLGLLWTSDQLVAETSTSHNTHNIHKKQASMPSARFELAIPASERPQTHASLDRAATGIGKDKQ